MHDITEVVKLANDDTEEAVDEADYYQYPRGLDDVYALKHKNGQWADGATYKITGQLGHKNVPADIVILATELAADQINLNINNYKSEKVGDWSVTYSDTAHTLSSSAQNTLANYRRISLGV
jgi:hypothetical protein